MAIAKRLDMHFSETTQNVGRELPPVERLGEALRAWSRRLNEEFRAGLDEPERAGDVLDADCRIEMRAFLRKRGGPYAKEGEGSERGIRDDETVVHNHELAWSGARAVGAAERYGTTDEVTMLNQWRKQEGKRDGAIAEGVVLATLNKFLGERYVAVRAAAFDDYEHGVDTLILDRENGGVVCAFDELVGMEEGEDRYWKKVNRAKDRLAKHGGMRVKYGLSFQPRMGAAPRLERRALPNVPGFCIALTQAQLKTLLHEGKFTPGTGATTSETALFQSIAGALRSQEGAMKEKMSPEQQAHIDRLITYTESLLS